MINLGYCCINTELSALDIRTNRGMKLATFKDRGVEYASQLADMNVTDLQALLAWNVNHDIKVFRIGANVFPSHRFYKLTKLRAYKSMCADLQHIGNFIKHYDIRVSTHPDHFVKLASLKPAVVKSSIEDLEIDNTLLDLMELDASPKFPINIHVGQGGDHAAVAKRFCKSFKKLSKNMQRRLVVENDDKPNCFSVKQLYGLVYSEIGTPITFDYFHHSFHPDGLSTEEAFELAYMTWPDSTRPLFHYSESKALNENVKCNPRAHADYVFKKIDSFDYDVDIDIEAKAKELALLKYRSLHEA